MLLFIFLPLIGALIGWVTNYLAVRLLFRPLQPWFLPLTSVSFQGLIPKRRDEIAEKVGQVVADELFSVDELYRSMDLQTLQAEAAAAAGEAVDSWCGKKMNLLPVPFRGYCSKHLRDVVISEVTERFPGIAADLLQSLEKQVDVQGVVTAKIKELSLLEVESLVLAVARRELKQIEWLGAVLGFIIGLFQALLVYFLL